MKMKYKPTTKNITLANLCEANACEDQLARFMLLFLLDHRAPIMIGKFTTIEISLAVDCAKQCTGGIEFLLTHGFIKRSDPKTYKRGDKFTHDDQVFILATIPIKASFNSIAVMINRDTGIPYYEGVVVNDFKEITEKEFNQITHGAGSFEFTLTPSEPF